MTPERKFEKRLVELAEKHGWYCWKVKWIGRRGLKHTAIVRGIEKCPTKLSA